MSFFGSILSYTHTVGPHFRINYVNKYNEITTDQEDREGRERVRSRPKRERFYQRRQKVAQNCVASLAILDCPRDFKFCYINLIFHTSEWCVVMHGELRVMREREIIRLCDTHT